MTTAKPSCFMKFLELIDVFSYIPVPQAYPVSTNKSKIGSVIFILALIGYLAYDFYMFVVDNVPIINAYQTDIINKGPSPVPNIAFGMYFKQTIGNTTQSFMLNNTSFFTYKFESYNIILYPNKTSTQTSFSIPLIACQNDTINNWTSGWYSNLTCVDVNSPLIPSLNATYPIVNSNGSLLVDDQVIDDIAYSYYLRLLIYVCVNSTENNNVCASNAQIKNVLANSTLYFLGLQPARYDYKAGKPLGLTSVVTYKYTVKANSTTTSSLYVYPNQFQMYPNFLTQWTTKISRYSRYARDYTTTSSTPSSYMYRVRIWPEWAMNIVQNHPQTLLVKLSEWSAFVGLILFIGGICFLTYNKNKFSKKNPEWQNFDETLRDKVYIELATISKQRNQERQKRNEGESKVQDSIGNENDQNKNQNEESEYEGNISKIREKMLAQSEKQK